jgi:tRNA1(Val) A37 N6-methylase TrmN6
MTVDEDRRSYAIATEIEIQKRNTQRAQRNMEQLWNESSYKV